MWLKPPPEKVQPTSAAPGLAMHLDGATLLSATRAAVIVGRCTGSAADAVDERVGGRPLDRRVGDQGASLANRSFFAVGGARRPRRRRAP